MECQTGEAWGRERLAADRVGRRLPEDDRPAAVRQALMAGRETAWRLRAAHGTADPFALAARLQVAVSWCGEPPALGSIVRIAEYAPRPPAIRLFAESVRAVGAADPSLAVAGIYVAHELYHHLEATGLEPAAAPARVTLARLGWWRWESGIRALSEIAAHAFAQALLDLVFFPGALDRLAARPHSASGAGRGSPIDAGEERPLPADGPPPGPVAPHEWRAG